MQIVGACYGWPGNHILLCNFVIALAWPLLEGVERIENCREIGEFAQKSWAAEIALRRSKNQVKVGRLDPA